MEKSPKKKAIKIKAQEPVEPQKEPNTPAISISTPKTVTITIKLGDLTYIGIGDTTLQALQAIEKPKKIVSKGIVTIEYDGQISDRYFLPPAMNRIFYSSPKLQAIHAKNLSYGLIGVKIV